MKILGLNSESEIKTAREEGPGQKKDCLRKEKKKKKTHTHIHRVQEKLCMAITSNYTKNTFKEPPSVS